MGHSRFNGQLHEQPFLSDISALLLAVTLLAETSDKWFKMMEELTQSLLTFRENGKWMESRAEDFLPVEAAWFDHPTPSGVSLAEMALTRAAILSGNDLPPTEYRTTLDVRLLQPQCPDPQRIVPRLHHFKAIALEYHSCPCPSETGNSRNRLLPGDLPVNTFGVFKYKVFEKFAFVR